jgi:hypothetical protein
MKHMRPPPVEAACQGKTPYGSYHEAARLLSRLRNRPTVKPGSNNIYRCPHCHNWHMGRSQT